MTTKKRFSISPDLAKGIRSTIQSASSNHGQLHYDMMAIDMIEKDPENPRKLTISKQEVISGLNPSAEDYQTKAKELESLKELAESIKRIGIRNAIEVYKEGAKYRIISGERRYLAAIFAGQHLVPVRINQKPDEFNLRYTQWVENINRQDLSLWEKFNNLVSIAEAYRKTGFIEFNEQALQKLLGVSSTQAYRYFCLLSADEKILELVRLKKLNNLKLVQELVTIKDKGTRNQIISWISSSKEEITSLTFYKNAAGKKTATTKKEQTIHLGRITNLHLAKELLEIILTDKRLDKYRNGMKQIDWNSAKSMSKVFKELFKAMEKELSMEEMA